MYGPEGYLVASDTTVQPAYGTATSSGTLFVWAPSTQGLPRVAKRFAGCNRPDRVDLVQCDLLPDRRGA